MGIMTIDLWVLAPFLSGSVAFLAGVAAISRRGNPPGRFLLFSVQFALALGLFWVAAVHAGLDEERLRILGGIAWMGCTVLCPGLVFLSLRFGQRLPVMVRGGAIPMFLSVSCTIGLLVWGAQGTGVMLAPTEDGDRLLGLLPGPSRAAAVALLLAACFGVMRIQSVLEAARRAGLQALSRAVLGLLIGYVSLVLTTSHILLYGVISLKILAFGSLASIPVAMSTIPISFSRRDEAVLPDSARLTSSTLLLLALGLFLIGLAAAGQLVHQFAPGKGMLWFRWGGVVTLVIFAVLALVPGVRKPLGHFFDRNLYAHRWDFRHEWDRSTRVIGCTDSRSILVLRIREYLDELIGSCGVAIWGHSPDSVALAAVSTGSVDLPDLDRENPLRTLIQSDDEVHDLPQRPRRLGDMPPLVENLDLIEEKGFRVFISLRNEESVLGILGIAPPGGFVLDADHRALIKSVSGIVGRNIWMINRLEANARATSLSDPAPYTSAESIDEVTPKHGSDSD